MNKIIDFRFLLFNNTAKKYMGVPESSEEMIGKTLTELFPATRTNGNLERYIDAMEHNKRYQGVEYFYPHEGMNHWFSESAYCFADCIIISLEDITDRKNKEQALKRLATRNAELDAFVYTASHDLRSPVNNMETLVGFLSDEIKDSIENANSRLYIDLLNKSIIDLKNTLNDLTTVTEIHPGEKKELVNLETLVEDVQVSLFKQIEEAGALIKVNLQISFLAIPKKHARSLIYNLLSNALKFRSKERTLEVTISSELKNNRIYISFSDNGIGIKEVDQAKVFMIFKRFNLEITGRGVGMYLVKRVVDLNEGEIFLESKENVGTTFLITFPVS
jgi:PAS domain S-box-containing protein